MSAKSLLELELTYSVELAWRVASKAELSNLPLVYSVDAEGNAKLCGVRWNTYLKILDAILPKNITGSIQLPTNPKEPWQE